MILVPDSLIPVVTDGPAVAAFTTRCGGVSTGPRTGLNMGNQGDRAEAVFANRTAVCQALGGDTHRTMMLTQVHGTQVHRVEGTDIPRSEGTSTFDGWPRADGLVTGMEGVLLAVLAADCLPVLLWRRDRAAVAAVHAGWRGMVDGVVEAAVAALGEPAMLGAALGPRIGPCCYPVSPDVRDRFASRFGDDVVEGEAVDLAASARAALTASGVPRSAIAEYGGCTSCQPDRFFSHRASGGICGRQAGLVMGLP